MRSTKLENIVRIVRRKAHAERLPEDFKKEPLVWVGWGGFNGRTGQLIIRKER